jgi:cell division protein FtsQ
MPREAKPRKASLVWRIALIVAGLIAAGVCSAMAGLKVREFTLTNPQFLLARGRQGSLTVEGLQHTSRAKVQRAFAADFDHSIFAIPLAERRRRLLAIDWVEEASVSRIWPDRLVVRLRERTPVAFVSTRSGVMLIDAWGVLLDQPYQAKFTFPVLNGISEDETEARRRERVRSFQELQQDLGYLAKDLSEVNVSDPNNLRIVARVEGRTVELILGDANFARRYQNFVTHYSEIRKRSPEIVAFDLRLDDRITAKARN